MVIILVILIIILGVLLALSCSNRLWEPNIHKNTIHLGLDAPVTFIHTTDTHLTKYTSADSPIIRKRGIKRTKRFEYMQEKKLALVSSLSKERGMTILHTGDIMDFVTDENIAHSAKFLADNDCLYVLGNHESENSSDEALTKLDSMASYNLLSHYAVEKSGIIFAGINNSNHRMTYAQLDFLKELAASEKPVVLLVHIPLYTGDLFTRAIKGDNSASLMAVPQSLMCGYPKYRYDTQLADQATLDCYDYITANPGVFKAIIAGHSHFDFETKLGGIPQYVTDLDSLRFITFD